MYGAEECGAAYRIDEMVCVMSNYGEFGPPFWNVGTKCGVTPTFLEKVTPLVFRFISTLPSVGH
jgi:hypothetical protein